jgi:hypothetical protein
MKLRTSRKISLLGQSISETFFQKRKRFFQCYLHYKLNKFFRSEDINCGFVINVSSTIDYPLENPAVTDLVTVTINWLNNNLKRANKRSIKQMFVMFVMCSLKYFKYLIFSISNDRTEWSQVKQTLHDDFIIWIRNYRCTYAQGNTLQWACVNRQHWTRYVRYCIVSDLYRRLLSYFCFRDTLRAHTRRQTRNSSCESFTLAFGSTIVWCLMNGSDRQACMQTLALIESFRNRTIVSGIEPGLQKGPESIITLSSSLS